MSGMKPSIYGMAMWIKQSSGNVRSVGWIGDA